MRAVAGRRAEHEAGLVADPARGAPGEEPERGRPHAGAGQVGDEDRLDGVRPPIVGCRLPRRQRLVDGRGGQDERLPQRTDRSTPPGARRAEHPDPACLRPTPSRRRTATGVSGGGRTLSPGRSTGCPAHSRAAAGVRVVRGRSLPVGASAASSASCASSSVWARRRLRRRRGFHHRRPARARRRRGPAGSRTRSRVSAPHGSCHKQIER